MTMMMVHYNKMFVALGLVVLVFVASARSQPACAAAVYCDERVLSTVQLLRLFNDSKTFVGEKSRGKKNQKTLFSRSHTIKHLKTCQ
jgi:hypothetical protein